jgi:class 3 adenylate cyclase/CHASE2 domain-containing sensor protein
MLQDDIQEPMIKSSNSDIWKGALQALAIAAVATLLVALSARSSADHDFDRWTYDFTVDAVGLSAPSREVVLVDFDEDTFQRIQQYPLPRSVVADVLSRIAAARPRVIGMDLFLSEPRTAAEDKAMQDALTASAVTIIASQAGNGTLPAVTPLPQFCQPEVPGAATSFCVEGAPGAEGYAFVNLPVDTDGFLRQANLFTGTPPAVSFPLMLAQQYAGASIKPGTHDYATFLGKKIWYADPELKTVLIGSWGRSPATVIPAWRLLAGQVDAAALADKLVLLGQSSDAARDTHFTPLFRVGDRQDRRLSLAGTQVQAAAIRTLLEGTAVRPAALWLRWCWIFAACLLAALLLLRAELGMGLARLVTLMASACGLALLLYAKQRLWLPFLPAELGMAATLPLTLGYRFLAERLIAREATLEREQMMSLFRSYVDPAVAETIWQRRGELSLAGEERIATVMFTDIRGFTAASSGKSPAQVLDWLNRYMTAMDEVIREHGGFLNKFIGDGLMVLFGVPLSQGPEQDALQALKAAEAMVARTEQLNRDRPAGSDQPDLRIGAGIHSGALMAGSIGSASRQEYSVIGETVNLASRLESLNKEFGTEILFSAATRELIGELYPGIVGLGGAHVKGIVEAVEVFTVKSEA